VNDLNKKNEELENEASIYQSKLGVVTNTKMNDDHSVQLNEDIVSLQDKIDEYVTSLAKTKVDVKVEEITKLLSHYECQTTIDSKKPDKQFISAILQRHVLETIFGFAERYFVRSEKNYYLESDVTKKTDELYKLMETFARTRYGTDEITNVTPIKLRQLIYTALEIRGLGDIIESDNLRNTHKSIEEFSENLNSSMNQYRVIKDSKKKKYVDGLAEIIIREVFRIFYFRLKIQEPMVQYHWFKCGDKVNKISMDLSLDEDEIDDLVVDLCTFPLIYQNIDSKQIILTLAKVFTHHVPKPSLLQNFGMSASRVIKSIIPFSDGSSSNDNLDQAEPLNTNSAEQNEQDTTTSLTNTPAKNSSIDEKEENEEKQQIEAYKEEQI
jgi:hypothetical protein